MKRVKFEGKPKRLPEVKPVLLATEVCTLCKQDIDIYKDKYVHRKTHDGFDLYWHNEKTVEKDCWNTNHEYTQSRASKFQMR